jgi:hypothetical protein
MQNNLYKVTISTDLMVAAPDTKAAVEIGKRYVANEIVVYNRGEAGKIENIGQIPGDWRSCVPYSFSNVETKKCFEFLKETENTEEDIKEIIDIKEKASKGAKVSKEKTPENRPDPKPKELPWSETKSGRPLPHLRFKI